jgi:hypothetical protein
MHNKLLKTFVFITSFFQVVSTCSFAQNFVLPNEEIIFSFTTTNKKKVTIAKDTANKYLIYRYASDKKTILNFLLKKKKTLIGLSIHFT